MSRVPAREHSEITHSRPQRTPLRLQLDHTCAAALHTVREVVEAGQRRREVTPASRPEDLRTSGCTGPNDGLEVRRPALFGPERVFAYKLELVHQRWGPHMIVITDLRG